MIKRLLAFILVFILVNGSILISTADSEVVVVSPSETVYSDNLLISIKVLEVKSIKVSVYTVGKEENTLIFGPKAFKSDGKLNFYTAQKDDIKKGSYKVVVDATDLDGKHKTIYQQFTVKDKAAEKKAESTQSFESKPSGTVQFVQNVLKSIFD